MSELSHVLPVSWNIDENENVCIGECKVDSLVKEYGSPLYIYCEETIRTACQSFVESFKKHYENSHIEFSLKAFPLTALVKIIEQENLRLDVVSGGELAVALAGGMPGSRINYHGNNKTEEELKHALESNVARITVDSFHELKLLNKLAGEKKIKQKIILRLSPSVDPHTHLLTTTGILDSKFGFSIETGAAEESIEMAMKSEHLELMGVHFHLGSPLFEVEPYEQAIEYTLQFCKTMQQKHGFELKEFSPGGGFAVNYLKSQNAPSIEEYAKAIGESIKQSCKKFELQLPLITVEPGRSITARAAIAVYTVGGTKHVEGVRTFVSIDGGMGDNIRPALYDAKYSVVSITKPKAECSEIVTIVGKFCESGDFLCKNVAVPKLEPGDLIAIPSSGAYNLCMSSNYNMVPRPAVVFVLKDKARLVKRRETFQDMMQTFL